MTKARDLANIGADTADLATDAEVALKAPISNPSFTGYVGMGTSSPDSQLHVSGTVEPYARFENTDGTSQFIDVGTNANEEHFVFGYGNYPLLLGVGGNTKISIKTSRNEFFCNDIEVEDWIASPISVRERQNVAGDQTDDKYSPNINFHWAGRQSNSLWMDFAGTLYYGEYDANGIPDSLGNFSTGSYRVDGTTVINSNRAASFYDLTLDGGNNISWGGSYASGKPTIAATNDNAAGLVIIYPTGNHNGEVARFDNAGMNLARGGYRIGGTTVIDSTRNLTNIGNISAANINLGANPALDWSSNNITLKSRDSIGVIKIAGNGTYSSRIDITNAANTTTVGTINPNASSFLNGDFNLPTGALLVNGTTVINNSKQFFPEQVNYVTPGYGTVYTRGFAFSMGGSTGYIIRLRGFGSGILKIKAFASHWTSSYQLIRESYLFGDSYYGLTEQNIVNVASGAQGAWTFYRPDTGEEGYQTDLIIEKSAGSYGGGMTGMITIEGQHNLYLQSFGTL